MSEHISIIDGVWTIAPPSGRIIRLKPSGSGYVDIAGKIRLKGADGAPSASGLLFGTGTTANPATSAVSSAKFIEIRAQSTATGGDNRLMYLRYNLAGAAGGGECIRAMTDLTAAVGGAARGAHISLQIGDTGYVSGLGAGVDAQLYIKNAAVPAGGTYAVINAEIYNEGSSSDISAVTGVAYIRATNSGNGTGVALVDDKAYLMAIYGHTVGSGNMVVASTTEANYSHAARVWLDGVGAVWLMFASASG